MFEEIVAKYRLTALYDNLDNLDEYEPSVSSDSDSVSSSESSYPGCSTKKACHIAILLKGL